MKIRWSRWASIAPGTAVGVLCLVAACSGRQSLSDRNGADRNNSGSAQGAGNDMQAQAQDCTPTPVAFTNAVCVCGDLAGVGTGLVTSAEDGGSANVGVNGQSQVVGHFNIQGSWMAYKGAHGTGDVNVQGNLSTTGSLQDVGLLACGGDLSVGGNLSNVGTLTVGGTLRLAGKDSSLGPRNIHATGPYTAPAGPPCGCDPSSLLDIAGMVADAKNHNDNATAGLSTDINALGSKTVTLKAGHYYFKGINSVGHFTINVDGAVSVYVDGSLNSVGDDNIALTPGSTLDLYVSGTVRSVGHTSAGEHMDPGAFRLYVGGSDSVLVSVGDQHLHGSVYAPNAALQFVGDTLVHGAIFAKSLSTVGKLEVLYHSPMPPTTCTTDGGTPPPSMDAGQPTPDAGQPPPPDAGQPPPPVDAGQPPPTGFDAGSID